MEPIKNHTSHLPKFLFLIIYSIILVFIYYLLITSGIHPLIAFLLLLFLFIIVLGPLFSGMRKSIYSRMFDKKIKKKGEYQKQKDMIKKDSQIKSYAPPRKRRPVNLNVKYRKPLIVKCSNCKMTVASFVKKCPKCGEVISS